MCGPLGVTHLMLFSRSESGNTNLRLARTPRGPTLHFRVEKYSLCKDIQKAMKHPRAGKEDFHTAPLLVMNNFLTSDADRERLGDKAPPKHLEKLVTDMFQGMFPPIKPENPLSTIKRVLLLNRESPNDDDGSCIVTLRHYAITTKVVGLPKALRRLHAAEKIINSKEKKKSALPNLGKLEDVADFMLGPSASGYTSASDTEAETDAEVEVAAPVTRRVLSKKEKQKAAESETRKPSSLSSRPRVEKRAVKLVELGPRLRLRLTKVEEDLCNGKVLWHEYVNKSQAEVEHMEAVWDQRKKEKEERRRIQRENIEKKRKEKAEKGEEVDDDEDEDMEDYDEYDMDDDVWHDEDTNEQEDPDEEMEDESDDG